MEPEESEAEENSATDDRSDKGSKAEEDWGAPAEQVSETLAHWFLKTLAHHHDENPKVFWEKFRGCWIMSPFSAERGIFTHLDGCPWPVPS
jgi:hypothetical protein